MQRTPGRCSGVEKNRSSIHPHPLHLHLQSDCVADEGQAVVDAEVAAAQLGLEVTAADLALQAGVLAAGKAGGGEGDGAADAAQGQFTVQCGQGNARQTSATPRPPSCACPSPPMLNRLAWKAMVTARPVKMKLVV